MYLVSDGSNKPYRCKIKAPGFAHLVSTFVSANLHNMYNILNTKLCNIQVQDIKQRRPLLTGRPS